MIPHRARPIVRLLPAEAQERIARRVAVERFQAQRAG